MIQVSTRKQVSLRYCQKNYLPPKKTLTFQCLVPYKLKRLKNVLYLGFSVINFESKTDASQHFDQALQITIQKCQKTKF